MWVTCDNVLRMSKMIQIRNVPEDVHRTLKARAAMLGTSLSDYLKQDLIATASRPSLEEIEARVAARGPSGVTTASVVAAVRDARDA